MTKLAKHDVELAIAEGQRFGIAFAKIDLEVCDRGVLSRASGMMFDTLSPRGSRQEQREIQQTLTCYDCRRIRI